MSIDKTQALPAVLANLRVRNLWLAQVSASTADEFYVIAVTWVMIEAMGASAGWIGAGRAAAILLASLCLGAFVHRWSARQAMVAADMGRAIMMCGLAVAALAGWAAPLPTALVVMAIAAMTALFDPALQSVIPTLTENPKHRTAINGLFDSTLRLARIAGPGLVALTAGGVPTAVFLLLAALLMVVSAYLINRSAAIKVDSAPVLTGSAFHNLMLGFKLVAKEKLIVLCFGVSVVNYATWAVGFMLGLPLLLRERMGEVDALSTYGALIAAYGLGNILANVALTLRPPPGLAWRFLAGAPFVGAGYASLAISSPSLVFMIPIVMLMAVNGPLYDLGLLRAVQDRFQSGLIGAVYRVRMACAWSGMLLGYGVAALLYKQLPTTVVLVGVGMVIPVWAGIAAVTYLLVPPSSKPN